MTGATRPAVTRSSARESAVIAALLNGATVTETAAKVGISRRTISRMKQTESFQNAFRKAKDELLSAAVARLHSEANGFVQTLASISADPQAQPNARVQAAREGLAALFKSAELFDLLERISKLETIANEAEK